MGKIKDLPLTERPRERGIMFGVETLSDSDLIAIILSCGTKNKSSLEIANEILIHFGGLRQLSKASIKELCLIDGINSSKAIKMLSAFELADRINRTSLIKLDNFIDKEYVAQYFINLIGHNDKEYVYLVLYNKSMKVLGIRNLYRGSSSTVGILCQEIFEMCICNKAKKFIVIHNHPSKNCQPSDDDCIETTRMVLMSAKYDLDLIDHLIVTDSSAYSIIERRKIV